MGGAPWLYCEGSADCITLTVRAAAAAALVAGTLALAVGPAAAQFRSGVNLVEVYASVTDARGNAVTDLKVSDFELRENGEPQTVTNFAAGEFPLSVAIGIDRSFSMSGTRLSLAKSAAHAFLEELRPAR
jgi:hypothetical protein